MWGYLKMRILGYGDMGIFRYCIGLWGYGEMRSRVNEDMRKWV